jgi:hypothetical protein
MKRPIYLEAPNYLPHYVGLDAMQTIFLAGSITGAANWQKDAVFALAPHFNIFNPRRDRFDVSDKNFDRVQIPWEHTHLDLAGITLFYFSPETLAPITLLEYGKQLVKTKYAPWRKTYVCIHPEYQRRMDVLIQTELENKTILENIYFMPDKMYAAIIKENA